MNQVVLSLGFGLVTASILALGAVGFTLQFGVTNLFNLAYGENMTVAAFVAYLARTALLGLFLLFKYTRIGKAMRATSDDPGLARSVGIPTNRVVGAAWLLSGLLAGIAGVALAMDLGTFDSTTGGSFLLLIVAAAVFGSVGEPYGAVLGALVIGIASELAANVNPQLKDVVAFAILVLVLLLRPEGLRSGRVQLRAEVTT